MSFENEEAEKGSIAAKVAQFVQLKDEKHKNLSILFKFEPSSLPNRSSSIVCLIYALLQTSDRETIFSDYFDLRRLSLHELYDSFKFNFESNSDNDPSQRKMTMAQIKRGITAEDLCIQFVCALSTDFEVLGNFFETDEKFVDLFLSIYRPSLDDFLGNYCSRLSEANLNHSLKSNDGGRELIIETFKKRGIKFYADYAKIIECVTYHLTEKLSVFEKVEADISNLSLNSPDQLLCEWRRENLAKISLKPLEEALGKQFQKWITDQDEQLMGQMKKNFKLQVHNGLLSRLSFVVKELSGFNSFNFQPAGNIFREALLNGSKQVFWLIKDACNSTGITFPVSRLLPLHRAVKMFIEVIKLETNFLQKSETIKEISGEAELTLKIIEEVYINCTVKDLMEIMNCEESRKFTYPKKPLEQNSCSPLIRMLFIKLTVLKNRHSAWPRRIHFSLYLQIFTKTYKSLLDIYRNASPSLNRSLMLRKDLQMAILLGKRHLNYFTQLSDPKMDQILSSQIRMFEKKLIVQFAPYSFLQSYAKELNQSDFVVQKSLHRVNSQNGGVAHFNDYLLSDLTRQNGAKLRKMIKNEFYQQTKILDFVSPKLYGSLCVEAVKDISLDQFFKICRSSAYDLYRTKFHILAKGLDELDKTLILPAFNTLTVKTLSKTKVLALLNVLESDCDALSTYSRAFIGQCSVLFNVTCGEVILNRLFSHLDFSDCQHFREIREMLTVLLTDSYSSSKDVVAAFVSLINISNEVCSDYDFEFNVPSSETFEIFEEKESLEAKFLTSAIKCPDPTCGEPKWDNLLRSGTQVEKSDFKNFLKLRPDKGSADYKDLTSQLAIDFLE